MRPAAPALVRPLAGRYVITLALLHAEVRIVNPPSASNSPKEGLKPMSKLTITWRGRSGTSYTFECFPYPQEFNAVSGVYIFCRPVPAGWEALYVGEAQDLKQRLNTGILGHDGHKRAMRAGMTHVAAMAVAGDSERLRVETDLRHGLNPSCNMQPVNVFNVNLFRG